METTKYPGVYKDLGKKDITYYVRFKKNGKVERLKVGKKSEGMTESKAKKILEDKKLLIVNGIDEIEIVVDNNNVTKVSEKMSLNQLANIYFRKWEYEISKEDFKDKTEKEKKNKKGLDREKSLYRTFWANWGKSKIPFEKVSVRDFINKIEEIQSMTKFVNENGKELLTVNDNQEYFTKPKYSSHYITNAFIFIQSIIKWTECPYNPLDLDKNRKHSNKLTKDEEELLAKIQFLKRKTSPRKEYLENHELKKYLEKLKENEKHIQGYLIVLIMATTGMRPESCLNLKFEDFNFKTKKINVYDFKRRTNYTTNLTPVVENEIIKFFGDRNPSHYLFFSELTKGLKPIPAAPRYVHRFMSEMFNKNKTGSNRIVLYTLRHSFATNLLNGIKDSKGFWLVEPLQIYEVSKLLNHASIETTIKNYVKHNEKNVLQAMNGYEESFGF